MKYYELNKEEKKLLNDLEGGKFRSVKNKTRELARFNGYTRSSLERTRNINIRLSERDYLKLKARAAEVGIPYQTLVSSVLHQYGN